MAKPPPSAVDQVVGLAKRRGFVYPCGEIYGGTRSAWDYGPLGVELKENIRRQWWRSMVQERDDIVGLDSAVILAKQVWVASGHLEAFVDPLTECSYCHKRFRADHLEEARDAVWEADEVEWAAGLLVLRAVIRTLSSTPGSSSSSPRREWAGRSAEERARRKREREGMRMTGRERVRGVLTRMIEWGRSTTLLIIQLMAKI